ncbi:MAG: hypothetical protein AAFY41_16835, partial [Bacteroidota bacterium]
FGRVTSEQDGDDVIFPDFEVTSSTISWGLGFGYALFLNESISLEPALSYNRFSRDPNTESGNERDVTSFINFRVGFNIYFKK